MFKKTILSNGIRIITEKVPSTYSISVGVWVDHGSRDETELLSGISHFIEHMIFKGTKRRSALEIAKAFDQMGGLSNAFTSKETICFYAKVLNSHEDRVLELLGDIFLNSTFSQTEIENERLVILQEISMVEDNPEELVHELFYQYFWPDSGLGRPVLGTPQTVMSINEMSLRQYVNAQFMPHKVVIACAGDVDHEGFVKRIQAIFGAMKSDGYKDKDNHGFNDDIINSAPRVPPQHKTGIKFIKKDIEQANSIIGFDAPGQRDEARYTALLLNVILGGNMSSRLFQEIREKRGLAYSIYSFHSGYSDTGILGMYAGTNPDKAHEAISIMMDEVRRLAIYPVDESELEGAKEHLKGGLLLSLEATDARMSRIAKMELCYNDYFTIDSVIKKIEAVTAEDIKELAVNCLEKGAYCLTLGNLSSKAEKEIENVFIS